jgi:aryl-alcohol dehydrogenase-like predicted oxidoreductase
MMQMVALGAGGPPVSRIGLGLAALGRPAYITTGRDADFGSDRSEGSFRARSWEVLDAAHAAGVRYVDVAGSYGSAEAFVSGWLAARQADDIAVGSKWGYTYVGAWDPAAPVHEVKDHSLATFERQWAESLALLGARLRLYQVHSATLESGVLEDRTLHRALAQRRDRGTLLGITTSGPGQARTIRRALRIRVGGRPLFGSVQATWNLLEPSVEPALREAAAAGWAVIVKEAVANGRLTTQGDAGGPATPLAAAAAAARTTPDAVAIAAALARPWATLVLSGAVTVEQLQSNVRALDLGPLSLPDLSESPADYWSRRSLRRWS